MEDYPNSDTTTITLTGKPISELERIRKEIELREVVYDVSGERVEYLAGIKYQNLTSFKEKAGLMSLYLKREEAGQGEGSKLRAVGNEESLEVFQVIYETHMGLYEQYKSLMGGGRKTRL